jgi:hypothetical protein
LRAEFGCVGRDPTDHHPTVAQHPSLATAGNHWESRRRNYFRQFIKELHQPAKSFTPVGTPLATYKPEQMLKLLNPN